MLPNTLDNQSFRSVFCQFIPKRPYCSNDLGQGLRILPKHLAISMAYVQFNPPYQVYFIVFDIDRADGFFSWKDANLPPPHWISKTPKNGHCHIGYMLKVPVTLTHNGSTKAIRYLATIQRAYGKVLGADERYVGLITKNPLDPRWDNYIYQIEPYELGYLADFVKLEALPSNLKEISGFGRNCTLFDTVRYWAYKAIREHINGNYDKWYTEVLEHALRVNESFLSPLQYSEIKATAKSISRWVWRNHAEAHAKFIERQSSKGKIGSIVANAKGACNLGGKVRSQQYSDLREEAFKLHVMGLSVTKIANQLGISRPTVYSYLKSVKVPS